MLNYYYVSFAPDSKISNVRKTLKDFKNCDSIAAYAPKKFE